MMLHKQRMYWFNQKYGEKLNSLFKVKVVSEKDGDFGALEGIQFDSDRLGGYLYFWSSGKVSFHLFDFELDEEIIEDSLMQIDDDENLEHTALKHLFRYIR